MFEYFKLTAATAADLEQLIWLLKNKRFYPETSSTPALPGTPNGSFDYRELMIHWTMDFDGMPIVRTREKISLVNFSINTVPTADWTVRYKLSTAPTITTISTDLDTAKYRSSKIAFLSYNYPNPQPGEI